MSTSIRPRFTTVDGLSIRYADNGADGHDALLLAPWPESVFAFEQAWDRLSEHAHLVAVDLPGFGRSEGRETLMNPKAMGEFIVTVADAFGLDEPHVVGPDIGTSAALFAAAAQLDRFRSLVIGSGGAAVPVQLGGALRDWVETTDLEPYRRTDGAEIVEMALRTIRGYTPPEEIRADYLASFAGDRFFRSMSYARSYPEQLPMLRDLLPNVRVPVRIVAGGADDAVPAVNSAFLNDRLPHSRADFIQGAGHFCWEEKPEEYASLITDWWNGGYKSV